MKNFEDQNTTSTEAEEQNEVIASDPSQKPRSKFNLSVCLIGRTNVGKSTLFNRLSGTRMAMTGPQENLTRDFLVATTVYKDRQFIVIDSMGLGEAPEVRQLEKIKELFPVDVFALVLDASHELLPIDKEFLNALRRGTTPYIILINKADGAEKVKDQLLTFSELGEEELISLSARYNRGIGHLWMRLLEESKLHKARALPSNLVSDEDEVIKVAIFGKPNVGKSTFVNRLVGKEIAAVSPEAGTTRDPLRVRIRAHGRTLLFFDTAGVRRRTKIVGGIEKDSVRRSFQTLEECDLCLLVLDAKEGMNDQDARLLKMAYASGKPAIVVVNKWDEYSGVPTHEYRKELLEKVPDIADSLQVVFCSALTGLRVQDVLPKCIEIADQFEKRVTTSHINSVLEKAVREQSPALRGNHRAIKFYFAAQIATKPAHISIQCNYPEDLKDSYRRYLYRYLQRELGFKSVPIKVDFIKKNPKRDRPHFAQEESHVE